MALNDAALVVAANAVDAVISHFQLYNGSPGAAGTTNAVGARVAVNGTVDGDGDLVWSGTAFTGLTANQPVTHVGYWSASSGGTFYGASSLVGDSAANSAGEYTVTTVTETSTAT